MQTQTAAAQADTSPAAVMTIIEEPEVNNLGYNRQETDPRVVRWGYNPGLRGVHLPPTLTGFQTSLIPIAKFFAHRSFETPQENFTLDENKDKEFLRVVTSADSELEVRTSLGAAGYQSLFLDVTDKALVGVIERTVLPPLSEIRSLFGDSAPILAECPSTDEMDLGEPREYCAVCHLAWITSETCLANLEYVAEKGLPIRKLVDGAWEIVNIAPSNSQLQEARIAVQRGLEGYVKFASKAWSQTISEIDDELRSKINDEEHSLRKDIHEPAPKHKELNLVREFATASAGARQPAVDNSGIAAAMMEQSKVMASMVEQNQQLINAALANHLPAAAAAPSTTDTSPPPEKEVETADNDKPKGGKKEETIK